MSEMLDLEPAPTPSAMGVIEALDYIDMTSPGPHETSAAIPKGAIVTVSGWATIDQEPGRCAGLYVIVDDGPPLEALYGLERPDVAEIFADESYTFSGFRAAVTTAHLEPGPHTIALAIRDEEGDIVAIDGVESFSIASSFDDLVLEAPENDTWTPIVVEGLWIDGEYTEEPIDAGPHGIVSLRGWAADEPAGGVARAVFGIVGSTVVKAFYGSPRDDVAADRGDAVWRDCGFALDVPLDGVPPGNHLLRIRMVGADGETVYDGPPVRVDVAAFSLTTAALVPTGTTTSAFIDDVAVFDAAGSLKPFARDLRLQRGDQLFIRGWAIDEERGTVARAVHLCIDDLPSTTAVYGIERTDVTEIFERPDFLACGFTGLIQTAAMAPGPHEVAIRVIDGEGSRFYETHQRIDFTLED
jgi:hypothetical protein